MSIEATHFPEASLKPIHFHGWLRDLPDQRDFAYAAPRAVLGKLPDQADLRAKCPPIYDQGHLGSCTANAIAGALEFLQMKQRQKYFMPSRLYIYYNERAVEGSIASDSGAQLRDGMKVVNRWGACREEAWPYDIARFALRPGTDCYTEGVKHQTLEYARVPQDLRQMKACLASGFPFVFGFMVYAGMMSPAVRRSGEVPMPRLDEQPWGGHAVMAVGYDEGRQRFLLRNSWGEKWGKLGYFTMPYAYLADQGLAADFWTIRLVE
jgi:C1A family cysteine protease